MQNKKECFEPDQRATQNKEELTEDRPVIFVQCLFHR